MKQGWFAAGSLFASVLLGLPAHAVEPAEQRWISAGGALSEWVVELGGADRLVAVDTTSRHLPQLQQLPVIGYQRQLAAEGILALAPDVLLGSEEMGPLPVLEQLRAAGVQVEIMPASADMAVLQSNLQRLGELLGEPQRGAQAAADYAGRLQQQQRRTAQAAQQQPAPGVLLLLGHAGASPLAAGQASLGNWLIAQAGGHNLARHQGYKALSVEALVALDPEVLLIADRSLQGEAARVALLQQNPALASTRAVRDGRVLLVDPTLLVGGLGPRLPDQLAVLTAAFYPALPPAVAEASNQP
ncbi:heme/hemin ABC transporter substrate-binding protein [Pseudomonas sp. N040]|uniref:heme/hemin ABC transporter substrate-binding protein n=1 Tax=Pseudomonas sp. N040 TaxID=2785325 RepID=UPI0018A2F23C|nr:ABC transporter substrate-binding protein [Pseudomonas sp. N040]MBF7730427.1 ABC transporter substrate-binding protein [Pseudomonas sp. N040]MBW7014070.1 ABC transporter substrate-binding protein [Pseudomonas sp. N040]